LHFGSNQTERNNEKKKWAFSKDNETEKAYLKEVRSIQVIISLSMLTISQQPNGSRKRKKVKEGGNYIEREQE